MLKKNGREAGDYLAVYLIPSVRLHPMLSKRSVLKSRNGSKRRPDCRRLKMNPVEQKEFRSSKKCECESR
jgi:hypothetical protein